MKTVFEDKPGCYPWRKTFAWLPVNTIGGQRVWLDYVYKRRVWVCWDPIHSIHLEPEVEYATFLELIASL